jgi:subtilisin family serine protease
MHMHRTERRLIALLALFAIGSTAVALVARGKSTREAPIAGPTAVAWRGLVGSRPMVALGQRVIVVLRTLSLAQRVERAGGVVDTERERAWSNAAQTAQRLLISRLALEGVAVHPDHTFTRVLDGFSTLLDPSSLPLVERDQDVAGVYPVRVAYPASIAPQVLSRADFAPGSGHRPALAVSAVDGRGVTIALLDTGVDPTVPYLRGRVLSGIDLVGGDAGALAASRPDAPGQLERHGTEMAGLLVGGGGPFGLEGVAPGASVLPVRVAGWQADALGHWTIYARSDQIVAGLERAVDPNDDGDAHDAARVALIALAEPFAGFDDTPEARAVAGASALDTLVVAPAGNDGAFASAYGDVAGPGGAPAALTVGAADARANVDEARIVVRTGLRTLLDGSTALAGAARPSQRLELEVAAPRGSVIGARRAAPPLTDFFTRAGTRIVAGRAALVPIGASPARAAEEAAAAGAAAVLLYGRTALPAGGLGLDESVPVPVVSVPAKLARALLARLAAGEVATVTLGDIRSMPNGARESAASFSSAGLAFDGHVKPELVAAGVGLVTSDPGANPDGSPRFATVNGSSPAAATVAGAAALVAQARPTLGADAIKGVLVGTGDALDRAPVAAQGAGVVDAGSAAAAELAASPATLAMGRSTGAGWRVHAAFTLTNLSTRAVRATLAIRTQDEGAAAVDFQLRPSRVVLRRGGSVLVDVNAVTASTPVGSATADGAIVVDVQGGGEIRVPWAIPFASQSIDLIRAAGLSDKVFAASDRAPTLLSVDAGRVLVESGHVEVRPVRRLDVDLSRADGRRVGLLVRMRDLLPGRYTLGITGRGPSGRLLPAGGYVLTLRAYPVDQGPASVRTLRFSLR